jgi:hypothetical protein
VNYLLQMSRFYSVEYFSKHLESVMRVRLSFHEVSETAIISGHNIERTRNTIGGGYPVIDHIYNIRMFVARKEGNLVLESPPALRRSRREYLSRNFEAFIVHAAINASCSALSDQLAESVRPKGRF